MSGSEELAQADDEQGGEGGEDYEGNDDGEELAAMQKELEKAEQQKAELDKLNKMQGTASADSKQGQRPAPCAAAAGSEFATAPRPPRTPSVCPARRGRALAACERVGGSAAGPAGPAVPDRCNSVPLTWRVTRAAGEADQAERDSRSIFIGNVDFATSVEEVCFRRACRCPTLYASRRRTRESLQHAEAAHVPVSCCALVHVPVPWGGR